MISNCQNQGAKRKTLSNLTKKELIDRLIRLNGNLNADDLSKKTA